MKINKEKAHDLLSNLDKYFYLFIFKTLIFIFSSFYVLENQLINVQKNMIPLLLLGMVYILNTFKFYQKPSFKKFVIYISEIGIVFIATKIMLIIGENTLNYHIASITFVIMLPIIHFLIFREIKRVKFYAYQGIIMCSFLFFIVFITGNNDFLKPNFVESSHVFIVDDNYREEINNFIEDKWVHKMYTHLLYFKRF